MEGASREQVPAQSLAADEVVALLRDLRRLAGTWRHMAEHARAMIREWGDSYLIPTAYYEARDQALRCCAADLEADLMRWADWLGLAAEYARGEAKADAPPSA